MEEAVVGAVVGAGIQVMIENLLSLSSEKINQPVPDLKEDLEKLKRNFTMIQNILYDADKQQVTRRAVKKWLKDLEDVAFEADDVLDELDYERLREEHNSMENPSTSTLKEKVMSMLPPPFKKAKLNLSDPRQELGHKIRDINKKLDSINQQATSFGLQMGSHLAHVPDAASSDASAGSETDSFTDDPIFIGRDNDVSTIVEKLTTSPTEQVFSVLPIVGMGGLGKTTLARKVFNNEKIRTDFGQWIWVHVSTKSDRVSLLKKILTTLKPDQNVEAWSSEAILTKLREDLAAKRYFLVLDDIWNQGKVKWGLEWDGFINSLSGISSHVKGNGIIVTTRNTEVASIVQNTEVYKLGHLSEDSCWTIIKEKAFGQEHIPSDQLEKIGKGIAKKCQGLPLAAYVVGGVLRRHKSEHEWLSIERNWLSDLEGDENYVSKILKLSFDDLSPPSLKKCFAYCLIFPKGRCACREELIELWMAEGFLQNDQRNDMETMGNKFFNLLLQSSLLKAGCSDDDGNIRYWSMHDLVHDLACSVLGSSKVNDNISDGIFKVRYIGGPYEGEKSSRIPEGQAKSLRTLFFNGEISDTMFSKFKSLHVLTLQGYNVTELPSSIRKLIHLRYLDISHTIIRCLPDSFGELYHLQTLRSCLFSSLRKLPSTLKYLINLRHLHIRSDVELPPQLGRLTSLQTLKYFKVKDEEGHRIEELGRLKNLKGELEISNLENVRDEEDAKSAYLSQKPNVFKLTLRWSESREVETNDENVLEGLQPHPHLKSLKIHRFRGTKFPLWKRLDNLVELRLEGCQECEDIPMLGHLPCLKSLYLIGLTNVRSIGSSFYGIDNCISNDGIINVFPKLKRLELQDMSNLKEWVEVESPSGTENQPCEVKVFPCLEYMEISNCKQIMSAPSHFSCLKELIMYRIDSGLPLANICGIKLKSLTRLKIGESDGLECFPDCLFYNNQNLSVLVIFSCPKLGELPDGLHSLISLEELKIEKCPNLKSITYSTGEQSQAGLTSLRILEISDCEGFINIPDLHSLIALEQLRIEKCPNLKSIPYSTGGQSQAGLTSLRSLQISDCEGLTNLPCEMIESCAPSLRDLMICRVPKFSISSMRPTLRSLQNLTLGPTSDSPDCVSFKETFDGLLQELQSLDALRLVGEEDWESLPDSLQHLTALSSLAIHGFGIEELPEWLGNLSSLNTLWLRNCKKLRRLPSVEAMRRLTKLTELGIFGCPLLRVKQQSGDDSEWAKVSHIPLVWAPSEPN